MPDPGLGVGPVEMRKTVSPGEMLWISEGRQMRTQRLPLGRGKGSDGGGHRILWELIIRPFSSKDPIAPVSDRWTGEPNCDSCPQR